MITRNDLIKEAKNLKSDEGENPEYDRALVELIGYVTGTNRVEVAKEIGLRDVEQYD